MGGVSFGRRPSARLPVSRPAEAGVRVTMLFTLAAALAAGALVSAPGPAAGQAVDCGKRLAGGPANDRLLGTGAGDRISGRGGADRLLGRGGTDCLRGGAGNDLLVGGGGADRLRGGAGRDRIWARDGARDVVSCGPGRDVARIDERDVARGCERVRAPGQPGAYIRDSELGPVPSDAYHLAPQGVDSNPGTAEQPWRTIERAIESVEPGDTVVLEPGTYGARGMTHSFATAGAPGAPITFRGAPSGPIPQILGHVRISADYQRLNYLLFDGPTGPVNAPTAENPRGEQVQITILGSSVDGIEISGSEIRNSLWHAGIYASTANDVRIMGNWIHHNGDVTDPGQENQSHGIYFDRGSGTIANNLITDNVARGVQLYAEPDGLVITNNTIIGNGKAGIQFAAQTANCVAVNNVVAYNGEHGIRSASLEGSGNLVRQNLVWDNGLDLGPAEGLTMRDNLRAYPGFGSASDYRPPAGSPAIDRAVASYAPSRDFHAVPRPLGGGPDLGAFETG